ncbi:ribonuclease R [Inquilinus ginsengisoli]|uniref:Ribonuclease R n=1 Tax=Inquilinus ginsengisoli TaxID=363840 RepID=A0ABU1JGH5_9PROT|nr:ribonuclease R [Inquilinus ginsengisoli]MDR6287722.1 ribonuclease R [Inquilinus ginsengisoli]
MNEPPTRKPPVRRPIKRRKVRNVVIPEKTPLGKGKKAAKPFPTREQILEFLQSRDDTVGKREIARAFHVTGDDRVRLKELLQEMAEAGQLEKRRGRRMRVPGAALPGVAVLRVVAIDSEGEAVAQPMRWEEAEPPPRIAMAAEGRGQGALAVGDRVLARLEENEDGSWTGRTMRRLENQADVRVVGVFRRGRDGQGRIVPVDKRARDTWPVREGDTAGAQDGDLVEGLVEASDRLGPRRTVITGRFGDAEDPRSISLIAIHAAGIPTEFRPKALAQAEAAEPAALGKRVDLRQIPLVTIDGADARDFDDAVWAEPDPDHPGGWHLIVAIADVAHYVPPGSPLDRDAFERGNSCYFPDRVVPMLPEALSNGLCSLRPNEDRACLAADLWIDEHGQLKRHRFRRGLMRSSARLTYEQVQAARDGQPDETTGPLVETVIAPLYGAYETLLAARAKRGTLELDLPERKVNLGEDGRVASIGIRPRLGSHKLIEEFMIAANVAAAETLSDKSLPALYRVHDQPDRARLESLKEFLGPLGYILSLGQVIRPRVFGQILERAEGRPEELMVNEMVLRSQAQAVYSPDNLGHFGLALPRYAHFTSPIRRYADLMVHRGLIRLLHLGDDGATEEELSRLDEIGTHISVTERRAAQAERDAIDRYLASWLSDRIGAILPGRIGGVAKFGLFVKLDESGADGLVPVSTLPDDFYDYDEAAQALIGRRWNRVFRLGAKVRIRVTEADPLTGSTVFALVDAGHGADLEGMAPLPTQRRRVSDRGPRSPWKPRR